MKCNTCSSFDNSLYVNILILKFGENPKIANTNFFLSLFCKVIKGKYRFFLRVRDKVTVNFERYRRIAMPEIFADGLNRHVLRQKNIAISYRVRPANSGFKRKYTKRLRFLYVLVMI